MKSRKRKVEETPAVTTTTNPLVGTDTPVPASITQLRKRKKKKDPAWSKQANKKQKRKGPVNERSILAMRTDTRTTFIDDEGQEQKVRTTFLIDQTVLAANFTAEADKDKLINVLQPTLEDKLRGITTYRKVTALLDIKATGTPQKVQVFSPSKKPNEPPRKFNLDLVEKYPPLYYAYSNIPGHTPLAQQQVITTIDPNDPFFKTEIYQKINSAYASIKFQALEITPELLKRTAKENAANGNRRAISQNQVMGGSANEYAKATLLFSVQMKFEWLHLIAHMILGSLAQIAPNLVNGGEFCNANMMFADSDIKYLSEQYPQGFSLELYATLIPGTETAISIEHRVILGDFVHPIIFNAQTINKPHISFGKMIHHSLTSMVEYAKKMKSQPVPATHATPTATNAQAQKPTQRFPFFKKEPQAPTMATGESTSVFKDVTNTKNDTHSMQGSTPNSKGALSQGSQAFTQAKTKNDLKSKSAAKNAENVAPDSIKSRLRNYR